MSLKYLQDIPNIDFRQHLQLTKRNIIRLNKMRYYIEWTHKRISFMRMFVCVLNCDAEIQTQSIHFSIFIFVRKYSSLMMLFLFSQRKCHGNRKS